MKTYKVNTNNFFTSERDRLIEKRRLDRKHMCGIYGYFDGANKDNEEYTNYGITNSEFIAISSQYKSLQLYDAEKFKAECLIMQDKEIPADMEKRLIITKNELIKAGVYSSEWLVHEG